MKQETTDKIIELAAKQVGVDPAGVTRESHFYNDLNYDSLDAVDFAMKVEDAFGINLPDNDVEKFKTVGNVVDYIHQRRDDTAAAA